MKPISTTVVITLLLAFFCSVVTNAQSIGISSSAVWLTDCNQSNYFNTSGSIGPAANNFSGANLGVHTQNSSSLILRGGELRSFKTPGVSNVCTAKMYYRIYPQSGLGGAFNTIDLSFVDDCNPSNLFPSGGSCTAGDQKWNRIIADGVTTPYSTVDLTSFPAGQYVLEVYYEITGSSASTSLCNETIALNNGGANYKAFFSVQLPTLSSFNPSTCNGTEGFITVSGLTPGATYSISYTDDGAAVGPLTTNADPSGEITIIGLNAGTYADFLVEANGCSTELNTGLILSNPVFTPRFTRINPFCAGTTPPALSPISNNGISGTWSPSLINNQTSGTYTFTPTTGQCGIPTTISVTVIPNTVPTFSFGTAMTICSGAAVPLLPNTSTNGITGTWNPTVVNNTVSGTYTFTPTAGGCTVPTTFTVTVNPNITPAFSFGTSLTICAGGAIPTLPSTSTNGISGTWNPAVVDNGASDTYTFTPSGNQCALTTTFTVTVNPIVTPVFSFGTSLNICAGAAVPSLPTTSDNGVSGTWSPATINNNTSGTYNFTPSGSCVNATSLSVTVAPNITPTFSFGTSLTICAGGTVPSLPTNSVNGIAGTWSPSVVDNNASGTYTFSPNGTNCATTASFVVTVNPNITPSFSFGNNISLCQGALAPSLPTTSSNGITGTWSPSVISTQTSGSYTFTPTVGQCAVSTTLNVTVSNNITPGFAFGTSLTICAGGTVPTLPSLSDNGISGTWNPSAVNNSASAVYTFTPSGSGCALSTAFTVTVSPNITPAFSFGTSLSICAGATVPTLPATSISGITGTWSPSIIDNATSGVYTFTPTPGLCATSTTFNVTVSSITTPAFSFGTSLNICAGSSVPALPATSSNGVTGTWNPASINNQSSGSYTFTPSAGQCANPVTLIVNVTPSTIPTFSFGTALTICTGGSVPALPTTSDNGVAGTWSVSTVSNTASAVYTFTPDPVPGQCLSSTTFIVTVNPIVTPTFSFGNALTICSGTTAPALPGVSTNGINGTWNPATINNQTGGTYTFTANAGQCSVPTVILNVSVNPTPTANSRTDTSVYDGALVPANILSGSPAGVNFNWTNSNTAIGLAASGSGNIPAFTATNNGASPVTGNISVTPVLNGCSGTPRTYVITVLPLNKDVFVPNVFSPNGDGKNDVLFAYGNYIDKLDMQIFNQWGERIYSINSKSKGWDGTHKGKAQPVGVYAYTLQAVLTDGRTVKMQGFITLLR